MSYAPPLTESHQAKNKPAPRPNVISDEQLLAIHSLPEKLDILATQVLALDAQSSQIEQISSSIDFIKNAAQSHREETSLLTAKLEALTATVEKLASDANIRLEALEKSVFNITSQKLDLSARMANARDRNVTQNVSRETTKAKKKVK